MKKILMIIISIITFTTFTTVKTYAADSEIVGPDVIFKQYNTILTTTTIVKLYSYNNQPITLVEDNYTGNGDTVGIYYLKLSAADKYKEVRIEVKTLLSNKIIAVAIENDIPVIILNKDQKLSVNREEKEPIDIIKRIGIVTITSQSQPIILTDGYSENYNSPGEYIFEFRLDSIDGSEQHVTAMVRVVNSDTLDDAIIEPEPKSNVITIIVIVVILGLGIAIIRRKQK